MTTVRNFKNFTSIDDIMTTLLSERGFDFVLVALERAARRQGYLRSTQQLGLRHGKQTATPDPRKTDCCSFHALGGDLDWRCRYTSSADSIAVHARQK